MTTILHLLSVAGVVLGVSVLVAMAVWPFFGDVQARTTPADERAGRQVAGDYDVFRRGDRTLTDGPASVVGRWVDPHR